MDDLSERLREYQKLMWAAPMKVPGVYQAVPIDLLVEAIEALAAAPEPLRVAGEELERLREIANEFWFHGRNADAEAVDRVLALITPDQPKQEVKDV